MKVLGYLTVLAVLIVLFGGCAASTGTTAVLPITLDSELNNLAGQISQSFSENEKTDIAIIEFSDIDGKITNLGRFLAEELTTRLYMSGKFNVVERQLLNKIMQEQEMSLTGMIDENSAVRLGHLLGVQAIVSGSITDLGSYLKVNARLISSESGQVFSVASVQIPKDKSVEGLLGFVSLTAAQTKPADPAESTFPDISAAVDGFLFKVLSCENKAGLISCKLQVINEDAQDRDLTIWFLPTNAWDENGMKYGLHQLIFAGQRHRSRSSDGWSGSSRNGGKVISGVPANIEILFGETSSSVTKLSLVEIKANQSVVKLRDILVR